MVHEYSHTTPAVKGILSFATFSERKHMLKTLKRKIALVAVAGLGAGLISVTPAFAAVSVVDDLNLVQSGSTLVVTQALTGAGNDVAKGRPGLNTIKISEPDGAIADSLYNVIISTSATAAGAGITDANSVTLSNPTVFATTAVGTVNLSVASAVANTPDAQSGFLTTAGKVLRVVPSATGTASGITVDATLAAGTYSVWADPTPAAGLPSAAGTFLIGTITIHNVGAPSTVAFDVTGRTQIVAAAADSAFTVSVKDSSARSTFLVGSEAISYTWDTVASTAIQVPATPGNTTAADVAVAAGVFAGQSVTIDNTLIGVGAAFNTTVNTTFKLNATIISGLAAFGSTSATYRWSTSTAGLVGTLVIQKAAVTTATHSMPAAGTVAAADFTTLLKDSTGAVVEGVTPSVTSSLANTVAAAAATGSAGTGNAFTYTATTSGTDTVTFSVSTGGLAVISTTMAITITAFGATPAVLTNATAVNTTGTGWVPGIAPAYVAGLTVTKISVSVTAMDAAKVAEARVAVTNTSGGAALTATLDSVSPIADAAGKITVIATVVGAEATDVVTIGIDANGGTNAFIDLAAVTYATAAADVSTSPKTATTTFAAAGSTQSITATVADQFSIPSSGATVTLTNTTVPVGATAQTAATVTVGSAGTAALSAVLGTVVGNYVYTVTGRSYNNVLLTTTNTITYTVTASGGPKAITIVAGVNTATTGYRVVVDNDGSIVLSATGSTVYTTATQLTTTTAESLPNTVITVKVTDDAGTGVQGVAVVAAPDAGVLVNSAAATTAFKDFNSATDLTVATDGTGVATFFVTSTKPGTPSIKFTAGSVSVTGSFNAVTESQLTTPALATGRVITLDKTTADVTGNVVQITATVTDVWGNAVAGVNLSGAISGAAGRLTGGGRNQSAVATDAAGQVVFEITSNGVEAGAGTLTVTATEALIGGGGVALAAITGLISDDLTANSATQFTKTSTKSATTALTVKAATTSAASTEITAVKTDVATANAAVKALATQVTVLQASVATLIDSLTTQIASLLKSVSALTKAVAKLQAAKKK
jgi:hypothetical protein